MLYEPITERILISAINVHSALGPGLLESAYRKCLQLELARFGLMAQAELVLPVFYRQQRIDVGYRIDLLVEDKIIVELKAVNRVMPVHQAQLLSYLKLSGKKVGLLINFNVPLLKDGITRMVND